MVKNFNLSSSSYSLLFAVMVNLLVSLVGAILVQGFSLDAENVLFNLTLMLFIQVGFLLVYYFFALRKRTAPEIGLKKRPKLLSVLLSALLGLLCIVAFYPLAYYFGMFLEFIGYEGGAFVTFGTPFEFILGIFIIVIAAPVGEELIIRSALLSGLKKVVRIPTAVILAALAFSLMHMNPSQTAYQFCMGIVAGCAALFTGSVFTAMIIHSLSNLGALLIDYTAIGSGVEALVDALSQNPALGIVISLIIVVVFSAGIAFVLLIIKKKEGLQLNSAPQEGSGTEQERQTNLKIASIEKTGFVLTYILSVGICVFMWMITLLG